jgi:hypothetical protein
MLILVSLVIVSFTPVELPAQADPFTPSTQADGRVQVTLTAAKAGTPTVMLRRAGTGPRNVILVDFGALTPESLSNAVAGLLIAEAMDPEGRQRSDRAAQRMALSQPAPVYSWAQEAIRRLRAQADARSRSQGPQSLRIWVAPFRRARSQP